jgi:ABC-type transport system involved in multi-copper enzyme maturation permease subunit
MFTIDDDNKLLKDVGLSTLLVAGLFLAVFAAATVVTEEIENKTILTILTKTVSRSAFVIGKFLGIAAAVLLAQYLLAIVLLMVIRHGVMQTATDERDRDTVVVILGLVSMFFVFLVGLAGNYFYRWRFSSTAIILATICGTVIMALLYFIDPNWQLNPAGNNLHPELLAPIGLMIIATLILTAIAVAAATRLGMIMTLTVCAIIFVLGAAMQQWLAPIACQSGLSSYLAWAALALVPAIDVFVVTDAITRGDSIPLAYVGQTAVYAFFYVCAALLFAVALFRNRQLG